MFRFIKSLFSCESGQDHIRPKIPFGSTKVCTKCGGKRFVRTYHGDRLGEGGTYWHEHISASCNKCFAIFIEKPKCEDR
jgi:hypothetical protein